MFNRFSNIDWIMVQSVDQVERIAVPPSGKAWVMVQNEPIFALRTADAMGIVTTELYRFERYEVPKNQYITAQELTQALAQLKEDINESIISATKQPAKRKTDTVADE